MFYELSQFQDAFSPLRIFEYTTFRTGGALLTALFVGLFFGAPFIGWLRRKQGKGQPIRQDDFLERHVIEKAGTPTMGGLLILFGILVGTLLWADLSNPYVWVVLFVTAGFGAIGFLDDYAKVTKQTHAGLSGRVRLLAEFLIAGGAVLAISLLHGGVVDAGQRALDVAQAELTVAEEAVNAADGPDATAQAMAVFTQAQEFAEDAAESAPPAHFSTGLAVPFFKDLIINLTIFGFVLFGGVVIVGAGNAVNMTDGLDGLAIVPVMIAAASFGFIAYIVGTPAYAEYLFLTATPGTTELAVLIGALLGAGLAFLWYNAPPAMVFMGDTGSLSLGGALGAIAVAVKHEIVLAIIGGLFVLEALSVIIQVGYFKLTGKRVFLMAPIHHHFEKMGWQESTVVVRFWIIAVVLAIIGLATLKLR